MTFEAGKSYRSKDGEVHKIERIDVDAVNYPMHGNTFSWTLDGKYSPAFESNFDLLPGAIENELKPLTYEEAKALKDGDVVRCLSIREAFAEYGLKVGGDHTVIGRYDLGTESVYISTPSYGRFALNKNDCSMFAKIADAAPERLSLDAAKPDADPVKTGIAVLMEIAANKDNLPRDRIAAATALIQFSRS